MAILGSARASARKGLSVRPDMATVAFTLVLLIVGFIVLYPIVLLVINSFQVGIFGRETTWGLDNWRTAISEPRIRQAIVNTLTLSFTRQGIAFVIGVTVAWLIARTNLPFKGWLEFAFWISFFLPTLTVTLGWILLLDSHQGLLNQLLERLPFVEEGPFDVFSWWGIVFVHLMTGTLAVKILLLVPAFRNMDASLEEASRAAGASTFTTLWRIVVPVMAPTILVVMVLGLIRSMEAFEVELILGAPRRIDVYSTLIYRQVYQEPPRYGTATALSMIALILILPLVIFQQWIGRRRSHATLTGKYSNREHDLGKWKWPIFALVAGLAIVMTVIPVILVVMSTFMTLFGFFFINDPWTLDNWKEGLRDPNLLSALRNTLVIGVGAALLSMAVFSLIAYISVRTKFAGRGILDFLTWLPASFPGIVISLGFLWLFLGTPVFRPLYGTIWILVVAVTLAGITLGVQVIKTNMQQLGAELEEASWAAGGSWLYTLRRIVLPLIAPAIAVVGVLTFVTAARATSVVALLATKPSQPLSLLQLGHMSDGDFETASVIGAIILVLTIGVALVARFLGLRVGIGAAGNRQIETARPAEGEVQEQPVRA